MQPDPPRCRPCRRKQLDLALREVETSASHRVDGIRRTKSVFHMSDFTSSEIPPDPDLQASRKRVRKLTEFNVRCLWGVRPGRGRVG
jgi:hypothetical protein